MYENGKIYAKVEKSQKPPCFMLKNRKKWRVSAVFGVFFYKKSACALFCPVFGVFLCINILNLLGVLYKIWWITVLCKKGHNYDRQYQEISRA